PDPSYTPKRPINVPGDITRDMQKQFSEQLAETSKYPELEYEKIDGISIVVNKDYPYDDVKRYGIVADFIEEVNPYTNNYDAFQKLLTIAKNGQSFYFNENGR